MNADLFAEKLAVSFLGTVQANQVSAHQQREWGNGIDITASAERVIRNSDYFFIATESCAAFNAGFFLVNESFSVGCLL